MPKTASLGTAVADPSHYRAALVFLVSAILLTICLLPFAHLAWPNFLGFVLINQTALVVAYTLSSWVLFTQFLRGRSVPLLVAASGTLYTAAIVSLQLVSFPGVVTGGRLLGSGPETTTWLWTFWHIGPPLVGITYAVALRSGCRPVPPERTATMILLGVAASLALATSAAAVSTVGLPWLPHQVTGDDYTALTTSGIGPAVQLFTIVAIGGLWRATRGRRSVLELWLLVGLALLVLDNFLTMAGSARSSVGWYSGRLEALASAFVVLWAYLHEVDALRSRAEAAAEEIAFAEAAMRQAQKMEAVGRLTGGIAHDFNNLLMVIGGGFDMIRRRPGDADRVLKIAEHGADAVERGARLTKQLLTFARRRDLRLETVNANELLLGFETLLRRAVGERVQLDFDLHPGLHPTQLDGGEFEAAILNLIVNARDALAQTGGRITVRTCNAERRAEDVQASKVGPAKGEEPWAGNYVVISVSDDGLGMNDATLARAFEPFFTTKEFGKGSGLGLAQVWGFARASGGIAEINSTEGQGTTVSLWLPWAQGRSALVTSPTPQSGAAALRHAEHGEVVLAVEDEPAVLAIVLENLADLGYRVIPARDAADAMEVLSRDDERVDVLFSDVVMPGGMNGVQLAVEARRLRPALRVVLTSGYTNEALTEGHGVPSNVAVLAKPYRREELARLLKPVAVSG